MAEYPDFFDLGHPDYLRRVDRQPGWLLLMFRRDSTLSDIDAAMATLSLAGYVERPVTVPKLADALLEANIRWVDVDPMLSPRQVALAAMQAEPLIEHAAPIYVPTGDNETAACAPRPTSLIVQFETPGDPAPLAAISALGPLAPVSDPLGLLGPFEHVRADVGDPSDVLDLIPLISDIDGVTGVATDWVTLFPAQFVPSQLPYWNDQWNLRRIGMPAAWDVTRGSTSVEIAVLDTGFELTRPGLTNAFAGTELHFDAWEYANNYPAPYDASARNTAHGTLVSGVLASAIDGSSDTAGIAPGCSLIPIRVMPFTNVNVSYGLGWARIVDSAVINMSFSLPMLEKCVVWGVEAAWSAGAVLCGASGNGYVGETPSSVALPALHPMVMAVGACDSLDRRKTDTSPDGDEWFSRFGEGLDLVAPGILCPSTDRMGKAGWNRGGTSRDFPTTTIMYQGDEVGDEKGHYFKLFYGTSVATAHASAVVALVRAHAPALTNAQVRTVVQASCEKLRPGTYVYGNYSLAPSGSWNDEVGYGLIRADLALAEAGAEKPKEASRIKPFGSPISGVDDRPVAICGLLGPGTGAGRWRVYSFDLASHVEFDEEAVLSVEPVSGGVDGSRVWVVAGTALTSRSTT